MSYRTHQTERGNEALNLFAEFLEKKGGPLSVSIREPNYSAGSWGRPDIVYRECGIEVKRVEFLCKHRFEEKQRFYAHLGHMTLLHDSWNRLKEWCKENSKVPALVIVLTWGRKPPIFIMFSQQQVDQWQQEHKGTIYIRIASWDALLQGEILR